MTPSETCDRVERREVTAKRSGLVLKQPVPSPDVVAVFANTKNNKLYLPMTDPCTGRRWI